VRAGDEHGHHTSPKPYVDSGQPGTTNHRTNRRCHTDSTNLWTITVRWPRTIACPLPAA
jgi:hypothetical protein